MNQSPLLCVIGRFCPGLRSAITRYRIHDEIRFDAIAAGAFPLRTTVTIEDALYEQALEMAEPGMSKADLIREALRTFVRVQSDRRLAALGGQLPGMPDIRRRRLEQDC
jgi:hypothetical protein